MSECLYLVVTGHVFSSVEHTRLAMRHLRKDRGKVVRALLTKEVNKTVSIMAGTVRIPYVCTMYRTDGLVGNREGQRRARPVCSLSIGNT